MDPTLRNRRIIEAARDGATAVILLDIVLGYGAVSYTHLRAHETVLDLVCRLLLEKKKKNDNQVAQHRLKYERMTANALHTT